MTTAPATTEARAPAATRVHGRLFQVLPLFVLAGCALLYDPATRLAYDLKAGVRRLGSAEGATRTVVHHPPARELDPRGSYTVQLDQVGALIVWYKDPAGKTSASASTSFHARFVDTPRTFLIDKPAGVPVRITVRRENGRARITHVD